MEVLINNGLVVGSFCFDFGNYSISTYDSAVISYMDSSTGCWKKSTYDSHGRQLSYADSTGWWCKRAYDDNGNVISYSTVLGRI